MTEFALYREPTVLDVVLHRDLKLVPLTDHSAASGMHASLLMAVEFPAAARDFTIVFVRGTDAGGQAQVSPVVLLGLTPGENLFVDGTRWDARYVPAYIRRYPFWTIRLDGQPSPSLMFDAWWRGFSRTEGDALFESEGKPAPKLAEAIQFIENFELEAGRTQAFCARLYELKLFHEMRAEVTLPGGSTLTLNDFLSIDEAKLQALPDARVIELHRHGMLGLIHAHLLSLANLQALVERKGRRMPATSN